MRQDDEGPMSFYMIGVTEGSEVFASANSSGG